MVDRAPTFAGTKIAPPHQWKTSGFQLLKGVSAMAKYSKKAQDQVEDTMHEYKKGKLKSGSGKKVKSRKQAVAIGLSKARKKGAKVPKKK